MSGWKDRFRGQIAMVTGAGSGIGLGISRRLADEGATVILADIDGDALQGAAAGLVDAPGGVEAARADITDAGQMRRLTRGILERHSQLDIAINCAGIVGQSATDIVDYDLEAFRRTLEVNLTGSFIVSRCAIEAMLPRGYGRVLLLSSIAGKDGNPGMAGYSASKAGVIGLTKGIGKEVAGKGITVNALAPALIDTPLTRQIHPQQLDYMTSRIPMGRLGSIDEAASLACWLVSREASFVTGAVFDLSGGRATY